MSLSPPSELLNASPRQAPHATPDERGGLPDVAAESNLERRIAEVEERLQSSFARGPYEHLARAARQQRRKLASRQDRSTPQRRSSGKLRHPRSQRGVQQPQRQRPLTEGSGAPPVSSSSLLSLSATGPTPASSRFNARGVPPTNPSQRSTAAVPTPASDAASLTSALSFPSRFRHDGNDAGVATTSQDGAGVGSSRANNLAASPPSNPLRRSGQGSRGPRAEAMPLPAGAQVFHRPTSVQSANRSRSAHPSSRYPMASRAEGLRPSTAETWSKGFSAIPRSHGGGDNNSSSRRRRGSATASHTSMVSLIARELEDEDRAIEFAREQERNGAKEAANRPLTTLKESGASQPGLQRQPYAGKGAGNAGVDDGAPSGDVANHGSPARSHGRGKDAMRTGPLSYLRASRMRLKPLLEATKQPNHRRRRGSSATAGVPHESVRPSTGHVLASPLTSKLKRATAAGAGFQMHPRPPTTIATTNGTTNDTSQIGGKSSGRQLRGPSRYHAQATESRRKRATEKLTGWRRWQANQEADANPAGAVSSGNATSGNEMKPLEVEQAPVAGGDMGRNQRSDDRGMRCSATASALAGSLETSLHAPSTSTAGINRNAPEFRYPTFDLDKFERSDFRYAQFRLAALGKELIHAKQGYHAGAPSASSATGAASGAGRATTTTTGSSPGRSTASRNPHSILDPAVDALLRELPEEDSQWSDTRGCVKPTRVAATLRPKRTPLEQAQLESRLAGRSDVERQACAVCHVVFPKVNLPIRVTRKALMDLWDEWDYEPDWSAQHLALFRVPPQCYERVSVCRFCTQFFPAVASELDAEVLSAS